MSQIKWLRNHHNDIWLVTCSSLGWAHGCLSPFGHTWASWHQLQPRCNSTRHVRQSHYHRIPYRRPFEKLIQHAYTTKASTCHMVAKILFGFSSRRRQCSSAEQSKAETMVVILKMSTPESSISSPLGISCDKWSSQGNRKGSSNSSDQGQMHEGCWCSKLLSCWTSYWKGLFFVIVFFTFYRELSHNAHFIWHNLNYMS